MLADYLQQLTDRLRLDGLGVRPVRVRTYTPRSCLAWRLHGRAVYHYLGRALTERHGELELHLPAAWIRRIRPQMPQRILALYVHELAHLVYSTGACYVHRRRAHGREWLRAVDRVVLHLVRVGVLQAQPDHVLAVDWPWEPRSSPSDVDRWLAGLAWSLEALQAAGLS